MAKPHEVAKFMGESAGGATAENGCEVGAFVFELEVAAIAIGADRRIPANPAAACPEPDDQVRAMTRGFPVLHIAKVPRVL